MFFNKYPYTDFHELNLDWLLHQLKDIKDVESLKFLKRVVVLGDSYLEPAATNPAGVTDPITIAQNMLADIPRIQIVYGLGVPGTAFGTPYPTKYFDKMVYDSVEHVADPETITDVIIMGGFNDRENASADIRGGILRAKQAVKSTYPNATLSIGHIGWSATLIDDQRNQLVNNSIRQWQLGARMHGVAYMTNSEFTMHNYSLFHTDYCHPNQDGTNAIAYQLVQYLCTGCCDVNYPFTIVSMSPGADMTTNYDVAFRMENNQVHMFLPAITFEFTSNKTLSGDSWAQLIQITQLRSGYAISNYNDTYSVKAQFKLTGYATRSDDSFISLDGWSWCLRGGFLWGRPMNIKADGSAYEDFSNIKNIRIIGGEITIPTLDC